MYSDFAALPVQWFTRKNLLQSCARYVCEFSAIEGGDSVLFGGQDPLHKIEYIAVRGAMLLLLLVHLTQVVVSAVVHLAR